MINKEIIINKKTREIINGENGDLFRLGVDGENLQENIVFKFDDEFVNGTARIEIIMQNNTKSYVMIDKVNQTYVLPVKSILTKTGLNKMQLVITQGTDDEEIPIFKSKMFSFFIADSVDADTEQPEEYPQWIDKANTTLNEIDNFNIDAIKELNEATITITDRYGTSKSVQVLDGENGQDAKINGVNTLRLLAGRNITLDQEQDELTINAEGGGSSAVTSVNGMIGDVVIEIPDVSDFITKDVDDLTNYEPKATTGNNLVASIDSSTYVMTITLRNSNNEALSTQTIDLPLETMVINGSYDSINKKIILTLKNGNTIEFSVADLISGLQSEITSSNKLNADLVDDSTSLNKFVSASEKTTWNAKSDFSGDYDDLTNKPYTRLIETNTYIDELEPGVYACKYSTASKFKIRTQYADFEVNRDALYLYIHKKLSDLQTNDLYATLFSIQNNAIQLANVGKIDRLDITFNGTTLVSYIYTLQQFITPGTSQTISGLKTFSTIPQQNNTTAPTDNKQFTNKKYVDDLVTTKTIQYETMPTASADYLDKIVQYIGTTDTTYTNGYFYKCVSDGTTYSWEQENVQPAQEIPDINNNYRVHSTSNNPFVLDNAKKGVYWCNSATGSTFYISCKGRTYSEINMQMQWLYLYEDYETANYDTLIGHIIFVDMSNTNNNGVMRIGWLRKTNTTAGYQLNIYNNDLYYVLTTSNQTFTGTKTFSTIPQVSTYVAPTSNTQLTAKKYVDDQISSQIGNINTILATLTTPSSN